MTPTMTNTMTETSSAAEKSAAPAGASASDMSAARKAEIIHEALENAHAQDIIAFDIARQSGFADVLFIVTASSVRHAQGLADQVLADARAKKLGFLRMEGHGTGQWILLDLGDVVVNVLLPTTRELYRLEGLWSDCPVLYGQVESL